MNVYAAEGEGFARETTKKVHLYGMIHLVIF